MKIVGEWTKRALSFPVLLGVLIVGGTYPVVLAFNIDPDFWWHLKTGEIILATHRWPTTDPYSYTALGAPWMAAEWLGDTLFALAWKWREIQSLAALQFAMASLVTLSLYGLATLRSGSAKAGFIGVAMVLPLTFVSFSLRPQMLGYLFLILTLIALEKFRLGQQRTVWLLPCLFLIWINTHGSWPLGLGVIALSIAIGTLGFRLEGLETKVWTSSERLRLEIVLMLCLLVLPITPYGTDLALYPFTVAWSLPLSMEYISEWQSMPFNSGYGKIFLGLLFGWVFLQLLFRFRWRLEEILLLIFTAVMACMHRRFVLLFVPILAPILATMVASWMRDDHGSTRRDRPLLNFGFIAVVAVTVVQLFPSRAEIRTAMEDQFPVEAVEHMREHPAPAPLFNAYSFGGYMVWSEHEVFIDGRSELFELAGVLADYVQITYLQPEVLKVLDSYGIRSCLILKDQPLATFLASQPDWRKVYSDDMSALYVKRETDTVSDSPSQLGSPI